MEEEYTLTNVENYGMSEEGPFTATAMPDRDWWQALWPDPAGVMRRLGLARGDVVDLCCGDGMFAIALAEMGAQVLAVDLDAGLLDAGRAEAARRGVVIDWRQGDARRLAEMVAGSADAVLMANTIHGVPDQPGLARVVAKALKPGGEFVVVAWHKRPREETPVLGQPRGPRSELRQTPLEVALAVVPAGFTTVRVIELPPYHYGIVFRRD